MAPFITGPDKGSPSTLPQGTDWRKSADTI